MVIYCMDEFFNSIEGAILLIETSIMQYTHEFTGGQFGFFRMCTLVNDNIPSNAHSKLFSFI